jgi:hypothetical protein
MRRKPIRREEVRVHRDPWRTWRIMTLPANSVRVVKYGSLHAIEPLWHPLLRELNQAQDQEWEDRLPLRQNLAMGMKWRGKLQKPPPVEIPHPVGSFCADCECRHCGAKFYRALHGGDTYCSDKCSSAARSAAASKVRAEARAAKRADRTCEVCDQPIKAQRSTMRFCSVRCRVAAHRNANG